MTHYRIYALGQSGHVLRGFDAECADDAVAKAFAFAGMGRGKAGRCGRTRGASDSSLGREAVGQSHRV